jgi:hypothetical protein
LILWLNRLCVGHSIVTDHRTCDGRGGRGLITGAGRIDGAVLDVPDFTSTCADRASFTRTTIFSLDRRNGTLIEGLGRGAADAYPRWGELAGGGALPLRNAKSAPRVSVVFQARRVMAD